MKRPREAHVVRARQDFVVTVLSSDDEEESEKSQLQGKSNSKKRDVDELRGF